MRKKLCSGALSILGSIIRSPCRHFTVKTDGNIIENSDCVKQMSRSRQVASGLPIFIAIENILAIVSR